jgi:5-methylthioribose kinase
MTLHAERPGHPAASTGVVYEGQELLRHLQANGVLGDGPLDRYSATPLPGGVSSRVILVEGGPRRLVAKQALPRLTVVDDWRADPRRSSREVACIDSLHRLRGSGCIPEIVWRDLDNNGYVMLAAPSAARTWKDAMLQGEVDLGLARSAAHVLGDLHRATPAAEARELFENPDVFVQLRVDPFYRFVADRHVDVRGAIEHHAESLLTNRTTLVHGDFSPKNILIWDHELLLLDYEVAVWGDPAFDVAFMLTHLALHGFTTPSHARRFRMAAERFWAVYAASVAAADELGRRVASHYACLLLARVDGKSPVDHLRDERALEAVRQMSLTMLRQPPRDLAEALAITEKRQGEL